MEYVRYKTLFKCEKSKPILVDDPIDGQIIFPKYLGVDSSIWQNQSQETNTFINLAVERDRYRSHEFAILLAGLSEMSPHQKSFSHLESATTKDRQWWLKLKRQINGLENRFPNVLISPTSGESATTPLLVEDVIAGELLWGATKAFVAGTIMLCMLTLFELPVWPSAFWVLPVAALGGLLFSSVGIIVTALSPKIEAFNLPVFLLIFPMFLFSGTFFPLSQLPAWAHQLTHLLPLTHVCALIRGAFLNLLPQDLGVHVIYLLFVTMALCWLAIRLMHRRLVK